MIWCASCRSYHVPPRDEEHSRALGCDALSPRPGLDRIAYWPATARPAVAVPGDLLTMKVTVPEKSVGVFDVVEVYEGPAARQEAERRARDILWAPAVIRRGVQ